MLILNIFLALFLVFIGFNLGLFAIIYIAIYYDGDFDLQFLPLIEDMRKWIKDGNKLRKYPKERITKYLK